MWLYKYKVRPYLVGSGTTRPLLSSSGYYLTYGKSGTYPAIYLSIKHKNENLVVPLSWTFLLKALLAHVNLTRKLPKINESIICKIHTNQNFYEEYNARLKVLAERQEKTKQIKKELQNIYPNETRPI